MSSVLLVNNWFRLDTLRNGGILCRTCSCICERFFCVVKFFRETLVSTPVRSLCALLFYPVSTYVLSATCAFFGTTHTTFKSFLITFFICDGRFQALLLDGSSPPLFFYHIHMALWSSLRAEKSHRSHLCITHIYRCSFFAFIHSIRFVGGFAVDIQIASIYS